jgi:general nucleoside transport system permease protein
VIRFEQRTPPLAVEIAAPIVAAVVAAVLTPLVLAALGYPIGSAFAAMASGAFGSAMGFAQIFALSAVLMLTGLATLLSFSVRLNNLGAEGQLLAGALTVVVLGTLMSRVPAPLVIMLATLTGPLIGALMMAVPATMKAKLGTDETMVTLLLNVVALTGIAGATGTALTAIAPAGVLQTFTLPATLPSAGIGIATRLGIGLVIAFFVCGAAHVINGYTVTGFMLRAIGGNPIAARFAGVPVDEIQFTIAALSGGLAGFAGAALALGFIGGAPAEISAGLGYGGIAVALLAGRWPGGIVPAALFLAALIVGTQSLSRTAGAPVALGDIAIALTLLTAPIASALTRFRVRVVTARPNAGAPSAGAS